MDKNEEYQIRNQVADVIEESVRKRLDLAYLFCENDFKRMVAYPLAALENQNKKMSELSIEHGFNYMELLITLNPLREAVYWYIHEMLKRQKNISASECFFDYDNAEFGREYCDEVLKIYRTYLNCKQIRINRSLAKVKLREVSENKYEILFPKINEEFNKEMLYFYGLDDALKSEAEGKKVIQVDEYLFEKFNPEKLIRFPERIFDYLRRIDEMEKNIDMRFYRLCIKRVSIDVNKIANEITSEIIANKKEIINVLALFYYLSRLCMHKYMFQAFAPPYIKDKRKNFCDYKRGELENLGKRIGIDSDTLNRYIDYFSMDIQVEKGGFGEFPLLSFGNRVLWIPSAILLNDFQFSIVNGHYYKDFHFPKHAETIAQSIVDYILQNAKQYENIIGTGNYQYAVHGLKYNGKDLQSDIDVALYDIENRILLIIECKWKENVYVFTDDYVRIERTVNEVYRDQLDKHKFYLEMDKKNYDKLFEGKVNISECLEETQIMYLMVDKRVQFHDRENNRHVVSTFMLAYFFKKYAQEGKLNLLEIVQEILNKKSEAEYERIALEKSLLIGDKTII